MKKCYILGATAKGFEKFLIYKKAIEGKLEILGTPIETLQFKGTNKERFLRAQQSVKESDVIIADMSEVSTGAGMELGMAHMLNKEIYVFALTGSKVSALIYGLTNNIYFYNNEEDLFSLLNGFDF